MKKWRRFFQSLFTRHIAAPERVYCFELVHHPAPDFEMIRFSVWHHFRKGNRNEGYVLEYDPGYEPIIADLRLEGWNVQLQAGQGGELSYSIYPDHSGILV